MIFHGDQGFSNFDYMGWHSTRNFVQCWKDFPTSTATPQFGADIDFTLTKDFDLIQKVYFQWTRSAITVAGGTSTFARMTDNAGVWGINSVQIQHTTNFLQVLPGASIFIRSRLRDMNSGQRAAVARLWGGDLSSVARDARAAATEMYTVELPMFFSHNTHKALCCIGLADDPRVTIRMSNLNFLLESDAAGGAVVNCTIAAVNLRGLCYFVTAKERNTSIARMEKPGRVEKHTDCIAMPPQVLAAASSPGPFTIRLTPRVACHEIIVLFRNAADDAQVPSANALNRFQRVTNIRPRISGIDLGPLLDPVAGAATAAPFTLNAVNYLYHTGDSFLGPNTEIYTIPWALVPEDDINATGSINLGVAHDPSLIIDATITANMNCYVYIVHHAWISLYGSDAHRVFA